MAKDKSALRRIAEAMPQEACTIVGTSSRGGWFVSRALIEGDAAAVRKRQHKRADEMNQLGASVRVVHERLNLETLCWEATHEAQD